MEKLNPVTEREIAEARRQKAASEELSVMVEGSLETILREWELGKFSINKALKKVIEHLIAKEKPDAPPPVGAA